MRELRRVAIVAACLLLLPVCPLLPMCHVAPGGVLHAQTQSDDAHAQELRVLGSKIDSLMLRILASNSADSALRDSVARQHSMSTASAWHTSQVGPFGIIARQEDMHIAERAVHRGWRIMQPLFNAVGADVEGVVFVVNPPRSGSTSGHAAAAALRKPRHYAMVLPRINAADEARWAAYAINALLHESLPRSIDKWLAGAPIGAGFGGAAEYSAGSSATEIGGAEDLQAVQRALAVARQAPMTPDDTTLTPPSRCSERVLADCRNLLALGGRTNPSAVPILRSSFLAHVLLHGDASARRTASDDDTADVVVALERLGGAPLDTLITQWLQYVNAKRAHGFADPVRTSLATLFWVAVLAALSMRSTRWRLG
jgi:hypothetical protein